MVLLGTDEVIRNATDRFVHIMDLDLLTATAGEVHQYFKYLESEN